MSESELQADNSLPSSRKTMTVQVKLTGQEWLTLHLLALAQGTRTGALVAKLVREYIVANNGGK